MLEKIDLSRTVEKEEFKKVQEEEGAKLGRLQRKLKEAGIPVLILFEGMEAAGKGVQINRLIQALDPRGFDVYASSKPTDDETMRPFLWKYWTVTPENGRIAIYDCSWYQKVLTGCFEKSMKKKDLPGAFGDICSFEKQLTDSGAVIIKLFLHISQEEQKKRFKKLEKSIETQWRVTEKDWEKNRKYDEYLQVNERMLERTDTEFAPWTIIEATDRNYAAMKILKTITGRLERTLEEQAVLRSIKKVDSGISANSGSRYQNGVLSGVDLSKSLTREEYKEKVGKLQKRLEILHSEIYRLRIPVVLGFEGWDAGGKGGAIKRLTSHLDPRGYQVCPTASPNDIERKHHYLWRFWNKVPKAGHIAIFDRTWYGRVMVERIEGFCTEDEWKRAYQEINEMEAHMANAGAVVLKFWLHIDKDEQERRFKERMAIPEKQWKITDEDWRNREKWDQYEIAVNEMLVRTSTTYAPWIVVAGNSKYYARVKVLQTVVDALEAKIRQVKGEKK
ncbi:MAG: polyphosphate:AMP phosphotransferase [Lachnospiraceae bacterium]|nr:polyphosphate:AMP phosphotransferase [Lachnospiraceae bacterium]